MKRSVVILVAAGLVGAGSYGAWRVHAARGELVLPVFTEPLPGPRAPRTSAFGLTVGTSPLDEVEALAKARGIGCEDTSARALMKKMRAQRAARAAEAKVDATTSASAKKKSPMEQNPQIRLSCEGTDASAIGDRDRFAGTGRLLFIFDSEDHPLRHASFRRLQRDHRAGLDDVREAFEQTVAKYGPPTSVAGKLSVQDLTNAGSISVPKYDGFEAKWSYADLVVTVSARSFGTRGIDVYESSEVPWPIRSDAPQRP